LPRENKLIQMLLVKKFVIVILALLGVQGVSIGQGIVFFEKDLKWGILDTRGKIISESKYTAWNPLFRNNLAFAVLLDGKWGDTPGNQHGIFGKWQARR
jgi:hypothetical protein